MTFITLTSFVFSAAVMSLTGKFFLWHVWAREGYDHRPCLMHDPVGSKRGINIQLKDAKNFDCDSGTDFFCWCPLFVFFLVYTYCPSCRGKSMDAINYVILFLRYCNSLANPLINSGINRQFRAGIKRCLFRRDEYIEEMQTTAATKRT